jgi:hypothetical protein
MLFAQAHVDKTEVFQLAIKPEDLLVVAKSFGCLANPAAEVANEFEEPDVHLEYSWLCGVQWSTQDEMDGACDDLGLRMACTVKQRFDIEIAPAQANRPAPPDFERSQERLR